MQFRQQGKSIQCIRNYYDPEVKRGRQVVLLKFPRWIEKLPPNTDLSLLTPGEIDELNSWFESRIEKAEMERLQNTLDFAPKTILDIRDSLLTLGVEKPQADALWRSIKALEKELKAAGYPKNSTTEKTPVVDINQTDIFD